MTYSFDDKVKEIISYDKAIRKCENYYERIKDNELNIVEEALNYTYNKFLELCIADPELVSVKAILPKPNNPGDKITHTLKYIDYIIDLLNVKIIKELA